MTPRTGFAAGAAICAALFASAYYLQYVQGLEPCPLCLVQRGFFYLVIIVFVIAAVPPPQRTGTGIYAGLVVLFAAAVPLRPAGKCGCSIYLPTRCRSA